MGEHSALTISEVEACGNAVQPEEDKLLGVKELRAVVWDPNVKAGRILPRREPPELVRNR